jgi:hypothetical protein
VRPDHRRWPALLIAGASAGLLAMWIVTKTTTPTATVTPPPATERWGVDQLRVHQTADGHLLDLRYRVVDPQRAGSLLAKAATAYLTHERSGQRLPVPTTPKAGPLRNTGQPRAGRSYFALFSNPGKVVKPGDKVSLVLGDLTAELTVE